MKKEKKHLWKAFFQLSALSKVSFFLYFSSFLQLVINFSKSHSTFHLFLVIILLLYLRCVWPKSRFIFQFFFFFFIWLSTLYSSFFFSCVPLNFNYIIILEICGLCIFIWHTCILQVYIYIYIYYEFWIMNQWNVSSLHTLYRDSDEANYGFTSFDSEGKKVTEI